MMMTRFSLSPLTRVEISGWLVLALLLWLLFTNHDAVATPLSAAPYPTTAAPELAPALSELTAAAPAAERVFAGFAPATRQSAGLRGLGRLRGLFQRNRPAHHQPLECPAYGHNRMGGHAADRQRTLRRQHHRRSIDRLHRKGSVWSRLGLAN